MWCCVFRGCSQRPGIPTLWITHVQASASHAGTAPWWALQIQQQSPFSATLSNAKLAGISLALALSSCCSYFSICTAKEPSEPPSLRWEALALCAASAWDMVPVVRRDAWHSLVQKSSGRQRGVPAWHAHPRQPQEQVGKGKWQRVLRDLRAQPCTETCQQDCPAAPLPAAHTNHQVGPRSCSEQLCWCDLLTSDCWLPKKMNYYLRKRTKIGGSSVERCSYFFEEMLVLGSRGKAADSRLVRIWFITAD